ncbi:TPA: hypothetical protein N1910_003949 [Pseudomonas aeruginosa C40A]|jgi:hypothetical protein|uniref:hypothetical protein n=1 Tax=Pseudomonadota TaxID=1224 RepID=UPI00053DC1C8|nr:MULTISPECIES: hypothetical protein [Pseudomonadota]HCB1661569.1 hypothetical protein [Citrobacter farmeri]HCL2591854.1 hypothetical protein [Pseudomonas aeruginosa C40A]ELG7181745.1 hypothetical protein [Pseudomonas aeruginosa]SMZ52720.1 hypothetical protein PANN_48870 [Pseudomonas aeruginosa C-NN2]HBO1442261.1 hypothetical protein [Pseudomonas aeruginosa]
MLRLLDYGKPNPFSGIIGKSRNLAWPVNAYRVTLPKSSNDRDGLNAFERVILKILDAVGALDADDLAAETCIPLDLINGILLRLQDKGFIDEYNAILMQEHDDGLGGEDNAPVFVTALLFRELATGKILPFLHWLNDANPLQKKEGEENDFRTIRWDAIHKGNTPTQRDVINALRGMKKRAAVFGMEEKMPPVQQITITAEPELYHLDCPIAIQRVDSEFRVADPFGNGFSLILEKAFEQLLEREDNLAGWLLTWKKLLSSSRPEKPDIRPKEPFETDANWQRYPKLIASLRPASNADFRTLAKIHASIEWALFYACSVRPFKNVITTLRHTEQSQHAALLVKAAQTIGFELPLQGFRPIREGKLREFEVGGAYQETVLAIAMLQARDDVGHPLRRLVSVHPGFINRLLAVSVKRNEKAHGKGRADAPQQELADDPFMRETVYALVPDIVFADTPAIALDKDVQGDALLDARASIQVELGFKLFNRLGTNLQDRLVHAERFFLSCHDGDDALAYVLDLCAAVQASFEGVLVGKLPPDTNDAQLNSTAESKAIEAGFCAVLPESLLTVKTLAVRQTLQGGSQSLGACVIAFLLVSDEDVLTSIYDVQPSFVDDMASLIIRRGHGNEPLPLPKGDIGHLRKSALTTIRTLMEF